MVAYPDRLRNRTARTAETFRERSIAGEPVDGGRQGHRVGLADESVDAVAHELQRAARIGRGDHRPGGEKRFNRHVSVIFVERRVDDAARTSIQVGHRIAPARARKRDPIGRARLSGFAFKYLTLRSIADDHEPGGRRDLPHRANSQLNALQRLESRDEQQVVAVLAAVKPIGYRRRMIQRPRGDAVKALDASRGVLRIGQNALALREHPGIHLRDLPAETRIVFAVGEIAVRRAVQVVGRAMLVHQPHNLAGMAGEPCREPRCDQDVDWLRVAARQIEHPPCTRPLQQLRLAAVKRKRDAFRVVSAQAQLRDERLRVEFGAIAGKRHARFGDHNSHRAARTLLIMRRGPPASATLRPQVDRPRGPT